VRSWFQDHQGGGGLKRWIRPKYLPQLAERCNEHQGQHTSSLCGKLPSLLLNLPHMSGSTEVWLSQCACNSDIPTSRLAALPWDERDVWNNPTGSLVTGTTTEAKLRATKSLKAWCLADLPRALLQTKLWSPRASTWEPQWHWCGTQRSNSNLKPTATLNCCCCCCCCCCCLNSIFCNRSMSCDRCWTRLWVYWSTALWAYNVMISSSSSHCGWSSLSVFAVRTTSTSPLPVSWVLVQTSVFTSPTCWQPPGQKNFERERKCERSWPWRASK